MSDQAMTALEAANLTGVDEDTDVEWTMGMGMGMGMMKNDEFLFLANQ
jgi:hypothetical protein